MGEMYKTGSKIRKTSACNQIYERKMLNFCKKKKMHSENTRNLKGKNMGSSTVCRIHSLYWPFIS